MAKTTDPTREQIAHTYKRRLLIGGWLLVSLGLASIAKFIVEHVFKTAHLDWTDSVLLVLFLAAQAVVYINPLALSILKSQDEYEYIESRQTKANAYNFLSFGVLLIIWAGDMPRDLIIAILPILLGMSWIITARGGAQLDV